MNGMPALARWGMTASFEQKLMRYSFLAAAVPHMTRGPVVRCSFLAPAVLHVRRKPVARYNYLAVAVTHVMRGPLVKCSPEHVIYPPGLQGAEKERLAGVCTDVGNP